MIPIKTKGPLRFKAGDAAGLCIAQVDIYVPYVSHVDDWHLNGLPATRTMTNNEGENIWCWDIDVVNGLATKKEILIIKPVAT